MSFENEYLESLSIQLIDGDRGKNYPKQSEFQETGYCLFLSAKNVTKSGFQFSEKVYVSEERHNLLRAGKLERYDIVLTTRGTIGNVAFYDNSVVDDVVRVNSGMLILRADTTVWNPRFLYFLFTSKIIQEQISSLTSGSAVPQLPAKDLRKFSLPKVPMDIQNYIVKVIGDISDKLKINHQTNQTLEQMAQAIFKSWFVDFDPVKAKMNGDKPEGMDAATASLFPEKLVESELGLIPEGWDAGTLSDVAKYCSARTSIDSICLDNYISTENMLADRKGVTTASKLPTAKMVAAYKTGDVLVSNIRPYFKKIWLAEGNGGRSNDVLGFESSVPNTDAYIMNLLYQDTFFEYMTRTSKGAKMPRGDKTAIMNWEIAVPPVDLREAYTAIVGKFYKLIPENRAQNETLESLRDALLPKLLSGEIELADN